MDTVNSAVLVDYDLYELNPELRLWCFLNKDKASFVLLVTEPTLHDYDPATHNPVPEAPDWQAVIRNKAGTPDIVFKTSALCVLQDHSNLLPVLAIDGDPEIQQMFRDGGVLLSGIPVVGSM